MAMPNGCSIPIAEQETCINIYRDSNIVKVYTTDSTMITKLDRMVEKFPNVYIKTKVDECGKWYQFPKKLVSFRGPTAPRTISDEERKKRAEHMRELNKRDGSTLNSGRR